jgi:hypothetical protein
MSRALADEPRAVVNKIYTFLVGFVPLIMTFQNVNRHRIEELQP